MELQQVIDEVKKEAADNNKQMAYWEAEHDKLQLVDIE